MAQQLQERAELQRSGSTLPRMTYEEFLDWADEDTWAEWVDGEVIILSPASLLHQALDTFLLSVLTSFVSFRDLGIVLGPPFQMKTGPDLPGREPDVIFVAREHLDRLRDVYLDGPADLVVEIVSPDSRTRDSQDKLHEQEEGGVPEYWCLIRFQEKRSFISLARMVHIISCPLTRMASTKAPC